MSTASISSHTSRPSRGLALGVLATGMLMTVLDGSITTVAMPAIQNDLGFSGASLSWVVNSYLVAFGALLLLAGRLGDLVGRKRLFLAGTTVFTLASLLAAAATTPAVLIAARFLQGVGSAFAAAVGLGILVTLFPAPGERSRAIAVYSFTGAAGASLGQVLGGVLTESLGWHWVFLINLPIGVAVVAAGAAVLPSDRGAGVRGGVDVAGAVLVTGGLILVILGVVRAGSDGWTSAGFAVPFAAGLLLLAGFGVRQATARTPLMPLRVLRSRTTLGAYGVQILMVAALFSFQVLTAQYLQRVAGYGAARTGIAMLPAALAIGAMSLGLSSRLIGRFGERAVLAAGLVSLVGVLGLLARVPVHASYTVDVLPAMLLGAGFGLALPSLTALAMSGAGEEDAGLVSGLFNTAQQVGMALGVAVLSTLAASRTSRLRAHGAGEASALTGGYHVAYAVGAGLLVAALAVAVVALRPAPEPAAEPRQPVLL